ncbi:MAG: hypothetical protein FJ387_00900 [Verrucomicrobia bacterium]|nr:hypothetical protein [Verrucomicrobiota bacterium]
MAISGQPVPDRPGEVIGRTEFSTPAINGQGEVGFLAAVEPVPGGGRGAFLAREDRLELLARGGEVVPGLGGVSFEHLAHLALNDLGEITLESGGLVLEALLARWGGQWRDLAHSGAPVPGAAGGTVFSDLSAVPHRLEGPIFRSSGPPQALFLARTFRPDDPLGASPESVWSVDDTRGAVRVATFEAPAPGLAGGSILTSARQFALASAPSGILAFVGQLSGGSGSGELSVPGLWVGPPDRVRMIAGGHLPVPTLAGTGTWRAMRSLDVNAAGQVVVVGSWLEGGQQAESVLVGTPAALRLLVRSGGAAPGADGQPDGTYEEFRQVAINEAGQVVVLARVREAPPNLALSTRLYRWDAGQPKLMVRAGADAWHLAPGGWLINEIHEWGLNAQGQLAFFGLASTGFGPARTGLWVSDLEDRLRLVAHDGIGLPDSEDQIVAVQQFVGRSETGPPSGGSDGRPRLLNDYGQVAFAGTLPDGRVGVFRTQVNDLTASDGPTLRIKSAPLRYVNAPVRIDANPVLAVPRDQQFTRLRVWVEPQTELDQLRVNPFAIGSESLTLSDNVISVSGVPVGSVTSAPDLAVVFYPQATRRDVALVLRRLEYGYLRNDLQAPVSDRQVHVELVLSAQLTLRATRTVQFQTVIGLVLMPPAYIRYNAVLRPLESLPFEVRWRLADGTSVPAADVRCQSVSVGRTTIANTQEDDTVNWESELRGSELILRSKTGVTAATMPLPDGSSQSVVTFGVGCAGLTATAQLTVLNVNPPRTTADCPVGEILFSLTLARSPGGQATRAAQRASPTLPAASGLSLADFYALRTWLGQSTAGTRLRDLFENHRAELSQVVLRDPALLLESYGMLTDFRPAVRAFLDGRADEFGIHQELVANVQRVFARFAELGSPALRATIEAELNRFNALDDFTGKTFAEWGQLLGVNAPAQPFLAVSGAVLQAGALTLEANALSDVSYSLWRTAQLAPVLWVPVLDASVRVEEAAVFLTDPNPGASSAFYQVRASGPGTIE